MNWSALLPIAKIAGIAALGAVLGTGGTLGAQKLSGPAPQIIHIEPKCPACPRCPDFDLILPKGGK